MRNDASDSAEAKASEFIREAEDASIFRMGFIAMIFIVLVAYIGLLGFYIFARISDAEGFKHFTFLIQEAGATNLFGVPLAAGAAFGIVTLFEHLSAARRLDGDIAFKIFSLQFSGPAGPATLWIACFLTLLVGIKVAADIDAQKAGAAAKADIRIEAPARH
ncbi:hypothetical protein [Sphingomonas sp.]|uniref:hypothetical protein n=1 Tax=Sphingomonas sp. TaxID=28214 RepID=UPI002FDB3E36